MIPAHDRPGRDGRQIRCAAWASSTFRWARTLPQWTPQPAAASPNSRRRSSRSTPVIDQLTVLTNLELQNAYPGTHATSNSAFLSAAKAKWTESTRLLPGHHRRSDRRAADRAGNATAVARTRDGSAHHGGPVRQRLRVRLPEQPFVVVADHAAAGRSASARRLRTPVRRWRHCRGALRGTAQEAPACSIG